LHFEQKVSITASIKFKDIETVKSRALTANSIFLCLKSCNHESW